MISPVEIQRQRPVALLGWQVADRLFGAGRSDRQDRSASAAPSSASSASAPRRAPFFGNSLDEFVVIPLGATRSCSAARQSLQVMVKPRAASLVQTAKDDARVALRVERRLKPAEPDNFGIIAPTRCSTSTSRPPPGIAAVLVGVVALSLVVGGIVIMNIMLMVVSERTREIGLRKALGAKRRDIMSQVLTESITLSLTGGVVGVALGALFATGHRRGDAAAGVGRALVGGSASSSPRSSACSSAGIRPGARRCSTRSRPCSRVGIDAAGLFKETARMALDTLARTRCARR
jgi:putative ABC transport system permease protein